ncbi:MAG TPA: transporter substrate-binding domain-containing protein [Burkholderiales bacterium]|nr:transporter substrate-binding domain-containing protein [Burkholderiales bacterium]
MTNPMSNFRARTALALLCICAGLALHATASARTLAEVKALNTITMCANAEALPYSSKNPDEPGFQIEIGKALADGLGLALNVEWILGRRRANVVNCDMMLDVTNDPEVHEGKFKLSHPYQTSGVALGLGKGAAPISDFKELQKGQKIGVMVGSFASMVLGKAGKTTSPYAFQTDMLDDLVKGELYGAAASSASVSYYIKQHPDAGLTVVHGFDQDPQLTWEVAVGLRKTDQALIDAVNGVLDKLLADGTIKAIYAKYGIEQRLR